MTDKELFEKYAPERAIYLPGGKTENVAEIHLMNFPQFATALKERDEERVCKNREQIIEIMLQEIKDDGFAITGFAPAADRILELDKETCKWTKRTFGDSDYTDYLTECGSLMLVKEDGFDFCKHCGKPIEVEE
jgi:hypothetical protein